MEIGTTRSFVQSKIFHYCLYYECIIYVHFKNWYVGLNGKPLKVVYHLTSRMPVGPNQGQTCQIAKRGFGLSCQNP